MTKKLETNYVWHCQDYYDKVKGLFKQITLTNHELTPEGFKKRQIILSDIGGQWYLKKNCNPPPPLVKPCLIKDKQE